MFSAAKMVIVIKKLVIVQSKFCDVAFQKSICITAVILQTMALPELLSKYGCLLHLKFFFFQ